MNISIRGQEIGTYDVVSDAGILLGHIIRVGRRWTGYDRHIGTFQGDDSATYRTFADAKTGAAEYYRDRTICNCGTLTCAGETLCPTCALQKRYDVPVCDVCGQYHWDTDSCPNTVDDTITGTAADCLEYGDTLPAQFFCDVCGTLCVETPGNITCPNCDRMRDDPHADVNVEFSRICLRCRQPIAAGNYCSGCAYSMFGRDGAAARS